MTIEREEYDGHVKDQVTVEEGGVVGDDGKILTYEEWMAELNGTTVVQIGDIKITNFDPGSGLAAEYSSQTWELSIGEKNYRYERWFTHNSGGSEWYDEDGDSIESPGEYIVLGKPIAGYDVTNNVRSVSKSDREATIDDIIDEIVDAAAEKYGLRYKELVQPLIDQVKTEVFPYSAV